MDGKPTGGLAVQFTVNEKVSEPEALEALGASPLPESITVTGVKVPTDVIERSYEPAFHRAPEAATPPRKTRRQPDRATRAVAPGPAGDCAVATVKDRHFDPEICGLGTKAIGAFEIGPAPKHPAADGEISSGGDSGAAWMFRSGTGAATITVLAGLHFAGEANGSSDEHALACLQQSVFEKLGVTLTPPASEEAVANVGYDPNFLSTPVPLPEVKPDIAKANGGSEVLHYTHFSLAMRKSRRFAAWVAWNIDGGSRKKLSRKNIDFVKDPRLATNAQVGNELYRANRLDRGHLARRADLLWGSLSEATKANTDSFFYTNITPQMDDFNQSAREGVWGKLEDAVFADVEVDDLKVSAFGGPVFADDDREFRRVKIPREFWKVLVFVENGELKARGFLLSQNLDQLEVLDLDEFRVFHVPLTEIEQRALLRSPQALHDADLQVAAEAIAEPLESVAAIQW